jgi:hypothetical protein
MTIYAPKSTILTSGDTLVNEVVYPYPCILLGLHVAHLGAQANWIQIHDSATVPAEGAVPLVTHQVEKDADAHIEGLTARYYFENGVYICESSTVPTKTLTVTLDIFVSMRIESPTP